MAPDTAGGPSRELSPELETLVRRHRDVLSKVLEIVAAEPDFRFRLMENPEQALAEKGLAKEIEALTAQGQDDEVIGHTGFYSNYCCYSSASW